MKLEKRFYNFLNESGCISEGQRLLVAVSGGIDSVALLHLLCSVVKPMKLELSAAHFDHSLREESVLDARFVEQLCLGLKIPVTVERQDVTATAHECKGNLEEVARDLRRAFLEKVRRERNCDLIVLGQHADDQAETFLMHLLRGAGSTGLSGMRLVNDKIVRPLLPFHKAELTDYLQSQGHAWREDTTNQELTFTRNRIRHELIPLLESFNPNITGQLSVCCEQLGQDEDFWDDLVADRLACCGRRDDDGMTLDLLQVKEMHPALSSRVIRKALADVRDDLRGISFTHIRDVLQLVQDGPIQGELDLPRAWVARRYDKLLLAPAKPQCLDYFEIEIPGTGRYQLPDGREIVLSLENDLSDEHVESVGFAADKITFPLLLRHCCPGDRFQPSGMQGSKKIQDLFVDLKRPKEARRNTLLLLDPEGVLWVVGLRRSDRCWPDATDKVLRVAIEPHI